MCRNTLNKWGSVELIGVDSKEISLLSIGSLPHRYNNPKRVREGGNRVNDDIDIVVHVRYLVWYRTRCSPCTSYSLLVSLICRGATKNEMIRRMLMRESNDRNKVTGPWWLTMYNGYPSYITLMKDIFIVQIVNHQGCVAVGSYLEHHRCSRSRPPKEIIKDDWRL